MGPPSRPTPPASSRSAGKCHRGRGRSCGKRGNCGRADATILTGSCRFSWRAPVVGRRKRGRWVHTSPARSARRCRRCRARCALYVYWLLHWLLLADPGVRGGGHQDPDSKVDASV